jgi:hypothetical protein
MQRSHQLAVVAGQLVAGLCAVYAMVLAIGLLTLPSKDHPIQDPWFTAMEFLILGIAPAMVAFCVGLQAWVPSANRTAALCAVTFMGMCATVTGSVHFSVLTLSRLPPFNSQEWASAVFAFRWPSVAYALDILAWDVFFSIGAACAAVALGGISRLRLERWLLGTSAVLALGGLAGVPLADMAIRNIGIIGYALVFPVAAALIAKKLPDCGEQSAA